MSAVIEYLFPSIVVLMFAVSAQNSLDKENIQSRLTISCKPGCSLFDHRLIFEILVEREAGS